MTIVSQSSVVALTTRRIPIVLRGRALERRFVRAAWQNRFAELINPAGIDGALSEKTFVLAASRLIKSDSYVSRAKSIRLIANLWREAKGQTLSAKVAFHVGKKLINDHIDEIVAWHRNAKAATEERGEALTQILSLVEPVARVTVHAKLLSHVNERALSEKADFGNRLKFERLSKAELNNLARQLVRRIEQCQQELLELAAIRASAFDSIEAGYDSLQQSRIV